jgi:phenylalanyl-tRNA synthetase beta subunit
MGQLKKTYQDHMQLKQNVFLAEIDFQQLATHAKLLPKYQQPSLYATIKLDITIKQNSTLPFGQIKEQAFKTSPLLSNVEVVDLYKDNLTLRFIFSSNERNITEEEAKGELEKIKKILI